MNSAINVREAELMEAIRINNSVIKQLEEENKKLKDRIEHLEFDIEAWKIVKKQLEEENKKLNLQIAELMGERGGKQMKIERLEERIKEHVPTQILADFRNRFKD